MMEFGDKKIFLWEDCIDPKHNQSDRGILESIVEVSKGTTALVFETNPRKGKSGDWDWSYWSNIYYIEKDNNEIK